MRITIDHKTNHAKTTNLGPLIGLIFFARSSTYRVEKFSKLQTNLEIKKK